jgi:hypothetical protein
MLRNLLELLDSEEVNTASIGCLQRTNQEHRKLTTKADATAVAELASNV